MIGVALVGLGDIALRAHLPALLRNPDVEVAALVDPDPARRALAAAHARAPVAKDVRAVLGDPAVRGVVLATPPWATTELITQVAAAGRYVLAEKPVATSLEAARTLLELPEEQRRRVQVGLTYRHDPALELLGDWLRSGLLGTPLLVRTHIYDERRDPADPAHARRIEETLRHGLPLVHEGAHVFDWFRVLFGPPEGVDDAWTLATRDGLPAPNLCGARLRYPQGTVVLAEFGWLTDAPPRCEISVLGDRGHVLLDGRTFEMELSTERGVERFGFEPDRTTRCFDRQLARFAELITGVRDEAVPDLEAGVATLVLAERITKLLEGRR
ncbi:Gfo/Idh/MocA family protein [Amycolatopsis sp. NPDC059021]|uniref:Gfo/Idh/MocA family protein n=1 Tax=Amycolatopsis sp. NPDC059021 TaxID=3346704 RepID=UPI00366E504F